MKRVNKRGQMFLLAGLIISVIVISFGSNPNIATIRPELKNFQNFASEVKHEAAQVTNYEIYTGLPLGSQLEEFLDNLSVDIRDKDPYANFMFIYGNKSEVFLRNYGSSLAIAAASNCDLNSVLCNTTLPGAGENFASTINLGGVSSEVNFTYQTSQTLWRSSITGFGNEDSININIKGQDFSFPIGDAQVVIFLNIKEINDEQFIAVE